MVIWKDIPGLVDNVSCLNSGWFYLFLRDSRRSWRPDERDITIHLSSEMMSFLVLQTKGSVSHLVKDLELGLKPLSNDMTDCYFTMCWNSGAIGPMCSGYAD